MNASLFKSDPRDFALQMVSDGLVSADHLLLCALKYMSHDDVRDMLDCNELSPRFGEDDEDDEEDDDDEDEDAFNLDDVDEDEYDVIAIKIDIDNGNFDADCIDDYRYTSIVRASFVNGQFTQAREQCKSYGLNYDVEKAKFNYDVGN